MTERMDHNLPRTVGEQAAEWFVREHCADLSNAERYAYVQWLKSSPVHIAELLRMWRLYCCLHALRLPLYIADENSLAQYLDPFEAQLTRAVRSYPVDTDTLVRDALGELAERRRWWLAAAAAIAVLVVGSMWFVNTIAPATGFATRAGYMEIGRASCRERV